MNNFKSGGPGGLRNRKEFIGGRPKSDANYGAKKSFGDKPRFGGNDRGGSHGGDRGGFSGGSRGGERRQVEMHKATCSTCGKPCEVPFRPDGSKPVLCSECFGKNRSDDRGGFEKRDRFSNDRPKRDFDAPRAERTPSPDFKALERQVAALESKVNKVLELLQTPAKPTKAVKQAVVSEENENEVITDISAKVRKPKKEVVKKEVKKAVKKVAKKVAKKK